MSKYLLTKNSNVMKMMKFLIPIMVLALLASCNDNKKSEVKTKVLTQEEQRALTPQKVIEILKQGNQEFVNNELTVRNNSELIKDAAKGQYPKAVILSCLDSRVPVEDVFHRAVGDIFVARVAGNIVNTDILGSMEFACKASGAKLVMVLGHGACGAVKGAISNVEMGNLTELLSKIKPAVNEVKVGFKGETTADNPEFVEAVGHHNVALMVKEIREKSLILKEMEVNGEIKIIGAYYDLNTGKVDFFEDM
jgi:carbonic anhydrase